MMGFAGGSGRRKVFNGEEACALTVAFGLELKINILRFAVFDFVREREDKLERMGNSKGQSSALLGILYHESTSSPSDPVEQLFYSRVNDFVYEKIALHLFRLESYAKPHL
ncbi:hypothetical protein Ddc_03481 [Ditylenchus destructor]|nr:hypothetical protein Ddc_03481 [Ditylenchus destructor]